MNDTIRRRKISWLVLPIGCALFLALAPATGGSQHHPTGQSSAPVSGSPAVSFELKLLDGKPVALANFRGKPVVMNFFATWCDPCRDEMPLINELAVHAEKDGYSVLGIAVEDGRAAVTDSPRKRSWFFLSR